MYNSILIPVALDHETLVAQKLVRAREMLAPGGKIILLTVLEQVSGFVAEFVTVKSENHLTTSILGKLQAVAGDAPDLECKVITGKPGVQIANYAHENGIELIIMGSHAPGATDYVLGSTTARVVRRAHCSVLVLR
ncbi:MAG: universal stress protein [Rhizobiales bacterium]|nr:universal stress protein [Hyphomicrobiales bacterium]MBO6697575.1 universal stress protein [Hyphomicrobiales bacterium]MBO6736170.1 universal stress protein [Hyphomicrobiales bacterium]MBO6912640.1 universal stress protein [Hyphomicrobiales bacterium]MBO6957162.1 universal stress protein [Hyphomicrobiales bacterium]